MLDPKMIPREARVAATKAYLQDRATDEIIAAALNAWPNAGKACESYGQWKPVSEENSFGTALILPLPKAAADE